MRIDSMAVALPKRVVRNEDVVQEIRDASREFQGDLEQTLNQIRRGLRTTGSDTRYWINGGAETSLSITLNACANALRKGRGGHIDMVICASVFGELIEPSTANLIAHELGLDEAECMDVKEACDGWVKAMKIADALIKTGRYDRILIVNGEFSMRPDYAIMPKLFNLKSRDELAWRFPIFTIGEAATATIVERDPDRPWTFTNQTRNDLYHLCTVAPAWHKAGKIRSERVAKDGPGLFTSWATDLSAAGIPLAIKAFNESSIKPSNVDILFTHASSTRDWKKIAGKIGLSNKFFDIHPRTGNLVSASIPAAMALAEADGLLKRDDDVALLCASAGMTFSTASFRY